MSAARELIFKAVAAFPGQFHGRSVRIRFSAVAGEWQVIIGVELLDEASQVGLMDEMPCGEVAKALGTTERVVEDIYGHHSPEQLRGVVRSVPTQRR